MATKPRGRRGPSAAKSAAEQALAAARQAAKKSTTWIQLHNALYGIGGVITDLFPTAAERAAFAGTDESKEIAAMLESLPGPANESSEASGRILARLPRSIHRALLAEAEAEGISLNQLLVAKLSIQLRAVV